MPPKKPSKAKSKKPSNVDKMEKAKVLDATFMSDKHKKIINKMTGTEVAALIRANKKFKGGAWSPDSTGAAF